MFKKSVIFTRYSERNHVLCYSVKNWCRLCSKTWRCLRNVF